MSDRRRPRSRAQSLLERLVGGIVETLLAEGVPAEETEERRSVVRVLHPLGQPDHVVPAARLGVKLGERDGGVGVRLELLDDVDSSVEVFVLLFQLGEGQADRVAVDRELGRYALRDR